MKAAVCSSKSCQPVSRPVSWDERQLPEPERMHGGERKAPELISFHGCRNAGRYSYLFTRKRPSPTVQDRDGYRPPWWEAWFRRPGDPEKAIRTTNGKPGVPAIPVFGWF